MTLPAFSTAKLIGIGIGALALVFLVVTILGWKSERDELRQWRDTVTEATRNASGEKKLSAKEVPVQIEALGRSLKAVTSALNAQNAAVDALGARTATLQGEAAKASVRAAERVSVVEGARTRLEASSRAGGPHRACEPSETAKGLWR